MERDSGEGRARPRPHRAGDGSGKTESRLFTPVSSGRFPDRLKITGNAVEHGEHGGFHSESRENRENRRGFASFSEKSIKFSGETQKFLQKRSDSALKHSDFPRFSPVRSCNAAFYSVFRRFSAF